MLSFDVDEDEDEENSDNNDTKEDANESGGSHDHDADEDHDVKPSLYDDADDTEDAIKERRKKRLGNIVNILYMCVLIGEM